MITSSSEQFLQRFSVRNFFHFTDSRNLSQIKKEGLLPWSIVRGRVPAPGGNDWSHDADGRLGRDKYVHLCLANQHPMEFRARQEKHILESRFLQIDTRVLQVEGVRFCAGVANKAGTTLLTIEEALEQMDFDVVYNYNNWNDEEVKARLKIARKYELLVPGSIPIEYIAGL